MTHSNQTEARELLAKHSAVFRLGIDSPHYSPRWTSATNEEVLSAISAALSLRDSEKKRADEAEAELARVKEAVQLAIDYDDLLRRYEGPNQVLFDGDFKEIDDAYDTWVSACRAILPKPPEGE